MPTRIENILQPIVGRGQRARAGRRQRSISPRSSRLPRRSSPTPRRRRPAIRSQQTVETTDRQPAGPSGVPGALSNQPPGAATAPLTHTAARSGQAATSSRRQPTNTHRENIVNYEVDKTIRHTKSEVGSHQAPVGGGGGELSARVRRRRQAHLHTAQRGRARADQRLAREAMGFSQERGDTLNVVNAPFSGGRCRAGVEAPDEWSAGDAPQADSPRAVGSLVDVRASLAGAADRAAARALRGARPHARRTACRAPGGRSSRSSAGAAAYGAAPEPGYEADLRAVKDLARQEPRVVANVVKDWVGQRVERRRHPAQRHPADVAGRGRGGGGVQVPRARGRCRSSARPWPSCPA